MKYMSYQIVIVGLIMIMDNIVYAPGQLFWYTSFGTVSLLSCTIFKDGRMQMHAQVLPYMFQKHVMMTDTKCTIPPSQITVCCASYS